MNLSDLFDPKSVAVIGASPQEHKVGYSLVYNLLRGKKRDIYPITINATEVLGLKCYSSILHVGSEIDLALIAVPADIVPQVLEECGKKGVRFAAIIAAGFKEVGEKGKILEDRVKEIAKKYAITILGPNCLGVMDAHSDLNATFSLGKPLAGGIAFLSQSGATVTAMLDWALEQGIGFSKVISLGNEAGLNELDFLEFLANDRDTKAILMFLEQIGDGRKFMKLVGAITRTKPVVALKAGRSLRGLRAVASHTGSLAPENAVFTAAAKQCGLISVESLREMFNLVKLFHMEILKPLRHLAVLTNGGGPSVITADLIEFSPTLEMAELSEGTKQALKKALPPMAAVSNPVDIIGDALGSRYEDALKILTAEEGVDGIIVMLTPQMMTEVGDVARLTVLYREKKPLIPLFIGGKAIDEARTIFAENGMANFDFPRDAVDALSALSFSAKKKAEALPQKDGAAKMMDFQQTVGLLGHYGIEMPGELVKAKEDLPKAFVKLGSQPVSLKVISEDIIHKTDVGGVRLNLKNISELESAWNGILRDVKTKVPHTEIAGMVVQPMARGKEVIIGMKRDAVFGPTVLFGLGGIFVEVMKDVSMRVAPVDDRTARGMLDEIKGSALLKGVRGEKPANTDAITRIIVAVSRLAEEHPEVSEIDLNPVFVNEKSATVVDARVMMA